MSFMPMMSICKFLTTAIYVCACNIASTCLPFVIIIIKTQIKKLTCGICQPEGDRLIFDVAHISDRHLAGIISKVLGS